MRALFARTKIEKFPEPIMGEVEQAIASNQPGRVKCLGTTWPARFYQPEIRKTIMPTEPVSIIAICGITMLVVPVENIGQ